MWYIWSAECTTWSMTPLIRGSCSKTQTTRSVQIIHPIVFIRFEDWGIKASRGKRVWGRGRPLVYACTFVGATEPEESFTSGFTYNLIGFCSKPPVGDWKQSSKILGLWTNFRRTKFTRQEYRRDCSPGNSWTSTSSQTPQSTYQDPICSTSHIHNHHLPCSYKVCLHFLSFSSLSLSSI